MTKREGEERIREAGTHTRKLDITRPAQQRAARRYASYALRIAGEALIPWYQVRELFTGHTQTGGI